LASGTCGWGEELDGLVDWSAIGAIFTKGLSLEPRNGHPPPRIWETPSGMLNAIGLENPGFDAFVRDKLPFLRRYRDMHGGRVIVNLFGTTPEEYRELAERLDGVDGVDGVEINLSCPNVKAGGIEFGRTGQGCELVTRVVREATKKFVAVKISPVSPIAEVVAASEAAGADAISTGNTMPAMAIDIDKRVPRISAGVGGLSGPALRPIAVRLTFEARKHTALPLIGVGGIATGDDAVEFMLAGASAVQVGTAIFANPDAARVVCDDLVRYLERNDERAISEIVGTLELPSRR
jgi:dihydroorotate dehydrogenase (NAD+) catalytic subunit